MTTMNTSQSVSRTSCLIRHSVLAVAAVFGLAASQAAMAAWPDDKPIRVVVPFPPGSSPDILARTITEPLAEALNQAIVIENRAGAGGNIGTRQVAQADPDGYSLLYTINGPLVTAPILYKNTLGYDPLKDLAPISLIATSPNVLIANKELGTPDLASFVAKVKADPDKYNYGSVGPGSASHLAMEMFTNDADLDLAHIPYSGFPNVINAILAGDIQASFMVPAIAMSQVKAGKIDALAISNLTPVDTLPGIPALAENGFPGFEAISWNAMLAPAGTDPEILNRVSSEITRIMQDPAVVEKFKSVYFNPVGSDPEELTELIEREQSTWNPVIEKLNISLE
ncbi:Bug family tripartite tricarboxylate transporter substrate binding protein [Orrella marina]|nr:tripartite tricarboxylate transporter substrate binding protein [Orrella marina]